MAQNRNFELIMNKPWAMKKEVLEQAVKYIGAASIKDLQAAATEMYAPVSGGGLNAAGAVAVIDIIGPISRYANCLSVMNGYATVEDTMAALDLAMADDSVSGIMLNINSPGGSVDGISELAGKIAKATKPVYAYAAGDCCSAAYWLASQADKLFVNDTGVVGSIGVYAAYMDSRRAEKEMGFDEYVIVSSQSPNKVPDPATDEGRAQIQGHIDALADIFIGYVAAGRNVTKDDVLANFGQGDVLIGKDAVLRGMADGVSNFDEVVAMLAAADNDNGTNRRIAAGSNKANGGTKTMNFEELMAAHPALVQEIKAMGAAEERERIKALDELADGDETAKSVIAGIKFDGKTTAAEAALQIVKAQKDKTVKIKADRDADAGEIPTVETGDSSEGASEETKDANALVNAFHRIRGKRG